MYIVNDSIVSKDHYLAKLEAMRQIVHQYNKQQRYNGPKILPCGTPIGTSSSGSFFVSIIVTFNYIDLINKNKTRLFDRPERVTLCSSSPWATVFIQCRTLCLGQG